MDFRKQISANKRDSWILMIIIVLLLLALGFAIGMAVYADYAGGFGFLGLFGVIAIVWSLIGYYGGAGMALAVSGAKEVTHEQEPQLWNVVEEMSVAGGLPMPKVYVMESDAANAFATGRDPQHAAVAVTRGLLDRLNREELQGVVAHEMSHVRNYDIRFATLIGIMVGLIALAADFFLRWGFFFGGGRRGGNRDSGGAGAIIFIIAIVLAILAPFFAYMVQFAISRKREYLADASGVELTRSPTGLADALEKIAADPVPLKTANRATAHLFISSPLHKDSGRSRLFDTHPPIQERIARLRAMAFEGPRVDSAAGQASLDAAAQDRAGATQGGAGS
jgi:heat shock protein HtpX